MKSQLLAINPFNIPLPSMDAGQAAKAYRVIRQTTALLTAPTEKLSQGIERHVYEGSSLMHAIGWLALPDVRLNAEHITRPGFTGSLITIPSPLERDGKRGPVKHIFGALSTGVTRRMFYLPASIMMGSPEDFAEEHALLGKALTKDRFMQLQDRLS